MFCVRSLSKFAEGGHNTVDGVLRVGEWRSIARSPRVLRANTGSDSGFGPRVGGQVTNFLRGSLERLGAGHEFGHFKHGDLLDITNVAHKLKLVEMPLVVSEVQCEIILHGDIKSLHFFGSTAAFSNCSVN